MTRRRKRKRPKGFSERLFRPAWNLFLPGMGIQGKQKRRYFNQLSGYIVISIGLAAAVVGFQFFGILGGFFGFGIGAYLAGVAVVKRRFFR